MKIYRKEKSNDARRIYLFDHKVLSYKKKKKQKVDNLNNTDKNLYDSCYEKRFSGINIAEQKVILEEQFRKHAGYELKLDNPQTFNEKIQWLKLFWHDPLLTKCADKVEMREYVKEKIGEQYLVPILGIYDNVDDIDFESLPNKFAIKVNWGSGENIIVKDKSTLDVLKTKKRLAAWMEIKNNHYYNYMEWAYKNIQPKIIIEKYIEHDDDLIDYKFMCYNGEVKNMFFVQNRSHGKDMNVTFYDKDFNMLPFDRKYKRTSTKGIKPKFWDEMIRLSEVLAQPFPFVRCDWYIVDDMYLKIGELTFFPGNGTEPFSPFEWDKKLGDLLKLPYIPYKSENDIIRRVGVYHDDVYSYPSKETLFRPSTCYPEYKLGDLSSHENKVYDMVRETFKLMKMDIENFGQDNWNPLKDIVKPCDNVLIKPNMVIHQNGSGDGEECLYTQPSVVAAVIDYVLIALQGKGKIVVGDAPIQECVFEELVKNSGYDDMVRYYQNKGVDISLVDFRNVKTYVGKDGLHHTQMNHSNDKDEGIVVQLDELSSFMGLDEEHLKNMRITNYDPRILQKHHSVNKHEYNVSKYVLDADVIINMPKPKTHRKAGMTAALKNLVGINANKEYLPHHTLGSKEEGGDAYLHKNESLAMANKFLDQINIFNAEGKLEDAQKAVKDYNKFYKQGVKECDEKYWEGSWYGNDTVCRTLFDLNKILFYADKKGKMQNLKQRRYFVVADMIVAGEREGPIIPSCKPCGIIAMGYDPACFDRVIASIMGFDYHLIPAIREVINRKGGVCEITCGRQPKLLTNIEQWKNEDLDEIANNLSLCFHPSSGWKKVLW